MVKIKNKRRLEWALNQHNKKKSKQTDLAQFLKITPRRFRHLYSKYKSNGEVPIIGKNLGRPKKEISSEHEDIIVRTYNKYRLNALYLEKVIFAENHIRIPHNTIHKVLMSKGFAKEGPNKQKRRKAWIRYGGSTACQLDIWIGMSLAMVRTYVLFLMTPAERY